MRSYSPLLIAFLLIMSRAGAQSVQFHGEASLWGGGNNTSSANNWFYGIRYLPELYLHSAISGLQLDADLSVNAFYNGQFEEIEHIDEDGNHDGKVKAYRVWARLATRQFEARLGLQKINFGAAALFRPLMWFDEIDPRDPLQITDGVYALLMRYYFLNNANIWLWGLYGNDNPKGWEIHPTKEKTPEFGGRIQYPVSAGELGLSYHHRRLVLNPNIFPVALFGEQDSEENRFGIDGRWDIEIGFWGELVLSRQDNRLLPYRWRRLANVGADYTLELGNGIHVLGEHFISEESKDALGNGTGYSLSAVSADYPLGVVDNVQGIFYYNWENEEWYRFLNWRRVYDHWTFFLMLFWNPDQVFTISNQSTVNNLAGKGIQIMLVFNH
ncbi:MAG: hypothetical protein EH225_11525 [Calditrichaeota bacterium]|nr:MAG: hypothetical protein EH225_11525 [Calditrichota bacterium]